MNRYAKWGLALSIALLSSSAMAFPQFLNDWQARYAGISDSGSNSGCQLCHGSVSGGDPWNAYGWDLVIALDAAACDSDSSGSVSADEAFLCVEFFNSDDDTAEIDNLGEISNSTQPGWSNGDCNRLLGNAGTTNGVTGPADIGDLDPTGTAPITGCDTGTGPPDPGDATIVTVQAGESIQAALDSVGAGSTILIEPGTYLESADSTNALNITKGVKLIGMDDGKVGVTIARNGDQRNGIVVVPQNRTACMDCHVTMAPPFTLLPDVPTGGPTDPVIHGLEIRNITIDGFINNGLFTERVDDFKIVNVHSVNNKNYGIFPTLSSNGLIQHSSAVGADDSGIWVETSTDVLVTDNLVEGNVNGFEVSNSDRITIQNNEVRDNTVGMALMNLTDLVDERPTTNKILVRNNWVHHNNKPNSGTPGSLLAFLPSGTGILVLAIDNSLVKDNLIENNNFAGVAIADYCLGLLGTPFDCSVVPPPAEYDPIPERNKIVDNVLINNGTNPDPDNPFGLFASDLLLFVTADYGNCFSNNTYETFFGLTAFKTCSPLGKPPLISGQQRAVGQAEFQPNAGHDGLRRVQ